VFSKSYNIEEDKKRQSVLGGNNEDVPNDTAVVHHTAIQQAKFWYKQPIAPSNQNQNFLGTLNHWANFEADVSCIYARYLETTNNGTQIILSSRSKLTSFKQSTYCTPE
jgi:hypothetical protein